MDSKAPRRLLTVGHSYVIATNRHLPLAIQEASSGRWNVTVAAPAYFEGNPRYGQLRPETLTVDAGERVRVVGIPMKLTTRIHVTYFGGELHKLMRENFDLVHCWEEPYILAGGQLAYWTPRSTALTFFSFQNISKRYPPPFDSIERYAIRRSDAWVAAGDGVEAALASRPAYRDRPHRVIGVGLDLARFRPDAVARAKRLAELNWPDDGAVTIGYLGRLTEAKGLRVLMSALERATTKWRALFIGSGELEGELVTWGARFGAQRFRHVSNVDHEDVPSYLNAFDVLCAPSQTTPIWREQFGRMLIEGFACGVPVIASTSGEIPNVVGDAGRIVDERDVAAWAREIDSLVSSRDLRRDYARRGEMRARARYDWSSIGGQYVEFFDEIVARRSQRRRPIWTSPPLRHPR